MKKNLILFPLKNTGNHFRTVDQVCVCVVGELLAPSPFAQNCLQGYILSIITLFWLKMEEEKIKLKIEVR